jgi:hypothetical protein
VEWSIRVKVQGREISSSGFSAGPKIVQLSLSIIGHKFIAEEIGITVGA